MDASELEKIVDLKLAILEEQVESQFIVLDMKLDQINSKLAKQVTIWKWVLGVISAILIPVIVAFILALIL